MVVCVGEWGCKGLYGSVGESMTECRGGKRGWLLRVRERKKKKIKTENKEMIE